MTKTPALWDLLGIYFNQDMGDDYGSEAAAIDAYIADDPDAPKVIEEIAWVLAHYRSEHDLGRYVDSQGSEYLPPAEDGGYLGWLTRIADRVRAATA